jgi:beta-N-acetylhexosaminidase
MTAAFITGLSGTRLSAEERAFLRDAMPAGLILFARNCESPEQVSRLIGEANEAIGGGCLVLIDQEGGRVRRLRPPHWRDLPSAAAIAAGYGSDPDGACHDALLLARLTAQDLRAVGINTNCAPVLDLVHPGAHAIIGDRAFGSSVDTVVALGRAVAQGLMAGGVVPVIKHMPGHGRALADSHLELPRVNATRAELDATDFVPFRTLSDMPAAMTAHVVYSAIDGEAPASISRVVTAEVIRGSIGFTGLLMSDDIGMKALSGDFKARAEAVIAAGSDLILHCSGNLDEMVRVAAGAPPLTGPGMARFRHALAVTGEARAFDVAEAEDAARRVLARTA